MTIALITGGNKGLGKAVAEQLGQQKITVILGSRDARRGEEAAADLRTNGLDAHTVALDVTDESTVQRAAEHIDQTFGVLDVLINNAGISGFRAGPPSQADMKTVREVFDTNFLGVITVTNAMLPLLRRSEAARIVNVSSRVGSLTRHADLTDYFARSPASSAYAPSKTALNMLTLQYAKELFSEGILVNAANPGAIATDFASAMGLKLDRTAADGARVIVKLATLGRDGSTGAVWDDDGRVPW
ncbi:SDR family oxidoreductase [Cryptosporangium phraense]|uniref:SDR family oxidoreductase n=1 Tax=Cryptosporangium phraense TaxID=2593070 RepID=A0A545AYR7_9ACTN|nr:SDR family oxidoreductase [Cryptosporangium phraense]TQS46487.1 SDR family oxidoreductase [Cryptosporangium phraense]